MGPSTRIVCSVLLVFGLVRPFLGKPVHVDDANFLRLAESAARDPWPHDIQINWMGKTEGAFDALSNPAANEPLEVQIKRFLVAHAIMFALAGVPG